MPGTTIQLSMIVHYQNRASRPCLPAPPSRNVVPAPQRIITTHNASGQAVLETSIPEPLPKTPLPGADTYLAYTVTSIPVPLAADADLATYKSHLPHNVGVAIPSGLVARVVDFPPRGAGAPLHRTETVDTGVVVDGELELFLDSGETAAFGKGDVFVQRGTIHGWRGFLSSLRRRTCRLSGGRGWRRRLR
ncbi:cupin domain protein [Colletotrichum tofieldiae]|uniref:Cupin domain protein n=1 Tax=Colletotrichum tofieldiae TaxID=708197 RepID=A0A166VEM8_9PEZI|nr:cupin domain protein [Colletotrichum tofieldiae]